MSSARMQIIYVNIVRRCMTRLKTTIDDSYKLGLFVTSRPRSGSLHSPPPYKMRPRI